MTFPVNKFSKISIEQVDDTRTPDARYYRTKAQGNKTSYFLFSLTSPPLPYVEYMALSAKVISYRGALLNFSLPNPIPAIAANTGNSVINEAVRGGLQVDVTTSGTYSAGDFIQFSNHNKAYMISDVEVSANVTLTLTSPLYKTVPSSSLVIYGADVVFNVSLNDEYSAEISVKNSKFGVVDVEVLEQA